jgi:hypothetical protein
LKKKISNNYTNLAGLYNQLSTGFSITPLSKEVIGNAENKTNFSSTSGAFPKGWVKTVTFTDNSIGANSICIP